MDEERRRREKVLFLDDSSRRIHNAMVKYKHHELTIVATAKECLRMLNQNEFTIVSLDHDLGGCDFVDPDDPTSGMEVIRYLEKTRWPPEKKPPIFIIHSSNHFAAKAMEQRLQAIGFEAFRMRYFYE